MGFAVDVVDPRTEPVPAQWDQFVNGIGPHPLWQSRLLGALAWYGQHPPLMAVVRDGSGQPAALLHARCFGLPGSAHTYVAPGRVPLVSAVECLLPPGHGTGGYLFHPDLDHADRAAVLAAYEHAVRRRLRWRCAGFVYRQVTSADLDTFHRRGRAVLPATDDVVIDNQWADFDGFLASRPRRQRKALLRLHRTVGDDPTVVAGVEPQVPAEEFGRLVHTVRLRYAPSWKIMSPVPPLFFDLLARQGCARYFTYRDATGALLACSMLVDDGSTLRCLAWGMRDRAEGGRRNLYLDHYLRQVAYLIEHRRTRMVMGKTMFNLKERFGARRVARYLAASVR